MKRKPLLRFLAALTLCIGILPATASANSAQPPALVIIMANAPKDASIALVTNEGLLQAPKTTTAWESYYVFYAQDIASLQALTLQVSGSGKTYQTQVSAQYLHQYDNVITLDFSSQAITQGRLFSRSILLIGLRVLLTLVIESAIFFLFGFRHKKSWLVFIGMNLLTQGLLNIALNASGPVALNLLFYLVLMEALVFIAETVIALVLIKEHGPLRRIAFVLVANFLSLLLGGFLITVLPV